MAEEIPAEKPEKRALLAKKSLVGKKAYVPPPFRIGACAKCGTVIAAGPLGGAPSHRTRSGEIHMGVLLEVPADAPQAAETPQKFLDRLAKKHREKILAS